MANGSKHDTRPLWIMIGASVLGALTVEILLYNQKKKARLRAD